MDPIAYLTCEIKHRDLEPRLEIAAYLLKSGLGVVIGQQWGIFENRKHFPPGLVLFKTLNMVQARHMAAFKQAGFLVAATDEEVLNFKDSAGYMFAFGSMAAENCDLFFAQNSPHAKAVVRAFPFLDGKIKVVGNARIDALAPDRRRSFSLEADEIKRQHGPFILFNTSFGFTNSNWGDYERVRAIAVKTGDLDETNAASVTQFENVYAWEDRNKTELTKVLKWAAENIKSHKIILRPHPGERPGYWMAEAPHVVIIPRSNPHPWIQACELVVHAGCTTGLEAALMDKPALNLMASEHPFSDRVVNWVNPKVTSANQAIAAIEGFLRGTGPLFEGQSLYRLALAKEFPTYQDRASAKSIAREILSLMKKKGTTPKAGYVPDIKTIRLPNRSELQKDKFTVSADEIANGLEHIRKRDNLTFRAKFAKLDDSLFFLSPS